MQHSKIISVLIPVYNGAAHIKEAIESILNQTYSNFEIVIVNDHSTDKTLDIVKTFDDQRILVFETHPGEGIVDALNFGLENCHGNYIARMDADDIALPLRLEKQKEILDSNVDISIVGCGIQMFGDSISPKRGLYPKTDDEIRARLFFGTPFAHPATMFRKSTLSDNNIKYETQFLYAEDYRLWFNLLKFGRGYNIPEVLLKYRIHHNQILATKANEQAASANKTRKEIFDFYNSPLNAEDCKVFSDFAEHRISRDNFAKLLLVIRQLKPIIDHQSIGTFFSKTLLTKLIEQMPNQTIRINPFKLFKFLKNRDTKLHLFLLNYLKTITTHYFLRLLHHISSPLRLIFSSLLTPRG